MSLKIITVKVEEELLRRIERVAAEEKVTRSELVRRAIKEYIERRGAGRPRRVRVRRVVLT